jgi:hypothetical protein
VLLGIAGAMALAGIGIAVGTVAAVGRRDCWRRRMPDVEIATARLFHIETTTVSF